MSFPFYSSPQNDIDRGRSALQYFHNYSVMRFGYGVKSIDELANIIGRGHGDIFLEGIGLALNSTETSESKTRDIFQGLAEKSQGKIPDKNTFHNTITHGVSQITFEDWITKGIPEISSGIAKDTVLMAQDVGEGIKSVASFASSPIGIMLIVGTVAIIGLGYLKLNKVI